jgi:hypothetical protein
MRSNLKWRAFQRVPWIWSGWERLHLRFHRVTPIREGSLFGVRRIGSTLELHLDSRALNRMRSQAGYSTFRAVHVMRGDLSALAVRVRDGEFPGVADVRAKTLMGEAGAVLGFSTRVAPRSLANAFEQYFQVGLDAVYHPRGLRERSKHRWPVEIWMTADELLSRYLGMGDYVVGVVLLVPAAGVSFIPRTWWAWLDSTYFRGKGLAFIRGVPGFVVGWWLLFGVFFPIDDRLGGDKPGRGPTVAEIIALVVSIAIWFGPMVVGRPRFLVPPGARGFY